MLKLDPKNANDVVSGVAEFVETVDLNKYANLKPNRGRLIVKKYDDKPGENKSSGGIVLTEEKEDKQEVGVVVAAGKGAYLQSGESVECDYKVGDLVYFPGHFGHDFAFGSDRESLLSIMASDVIASL